MRTVQYHLQVQVEGENKIQHMSGTVEIDGEKWDKILEQCKYRKASVTQLIEDYLSKLTPDQAEDILWSWDM